jgi:hypothetical protein
LLLGNVGKTKSSRWVNVEREREIQDISSENRERTNKTCIQC